jgi:hypothetical protein
VVATFYFEALFPISRRQFLYEPKRDLQQLYLQPRLREEFEQTVSNKVQAFAATYTLLGYEPAPAERYSDLKQALEQAVAERVPIAPRKINGKIVYSHDQRMRKLSKKKTALWQTFRSTPLRRANRRAHLKEQLAEVRKQMRRRIVQLNSERVQTIAAELEKNSGNRQMYEYARIMQKREYRPPYFRDNEGFMESDPAKIEPMVTETYTRFFNQQGKQPTAQWEGIARPLEQRITADEIRAAIARLRNHRATGPDERTAEEFKYGGETVVTELEIIFNTMFETHSTLHWGVPNIVMNSISGINGTISTSKGPLTNSFNVSATVKVNGQTWVSTYLLLSVNGGATLLLQSGIKGNGDGEPATGACNRI